jgi:hypothetical protein
VYATARDPATATELNAAAKELGNVCVLQLDSDDEQSIKAAAEVVRKESGRLNIVIANAGVSVVVNPGTIRCWTETPIHLLFSIADEKRQGYAARHNPQYQGRVLYE